MTALRKKQHDAKRRGAAPFPLRTGPLLALIPSTARVFGYARVSTDDQVLDLQITALRNAGAEQLFVEKVSAASAKRPMFNLVRKHLERGDTLIVYAFSRLVRDLKQLLILVDELKAEGVTLRSTSEPHIDPYSTNGRLLLSVTGAVDENERGRVRDRTRDGMAEKKRQGMYLGRPRLIEKKDIPIMKRMRWKLHIDVKIIAKRFKCEPSTVYSYTKR